MKIQIEAKVEQSGAHGNDNPRLIFSGPLWDEWDLEFCIHGEKLRWGCDECDEYFEKHKRRS